MTLDIICLAAFDYPVRALDDDDNPLSKVFEAMLRIRKPNKARAIVFTLITEISWLEGLPVALLRAAKQGIATLQQEAKNMMGRKLDMVGTELDEQGDILSRIIKASSQAVSAKDSLSVEEVSRQLS